MLDGGKIKEYVVAGGFKRHPTNSSFNGQAYAHYDNYFGLDKELNENSWRTRVGSLIWTNNVQHLGYYQGATITSLIPSAAILFTVSALSIGFKVYNTSNLNPANVLRDE